ncbi:MAG: ABC transporter permease subunit, partial [Anaerolineae bacterium]
ALSKPFIEAARGTGGSEGRSIFTHLLPHMLPLTAANMMLAVTGAVIADGFIWFMGLRNVRVNWGAMIYDALFFSSSVILPPEAIPWHALLPPALALSVFALAFYLVSRGLLDVADPQGRRR